MEHGGLAYEGGGGQQCVGGGGGMRVCVGGYIVRACVRVCVCGVHGVCVCGGGGVQAVACCLINKSRLCVQLCMCARLYVLSV